MGIHNMAQDDLLKHALETSTQALEKSTEALLKAEHIQDVCSERYSLVDTKLDGFIKLVEIRFDGFNDAMNKHFNETNGIKKILWGVAGAIIMTLLAACGTLLSILLKH
jgi:hypothetical protein